MNDLVDPDSFLFLFFSGNIREPGRFKLSRREWFADWLIERVSGSPVTHVAIGDGSVVLVPTMRRTGYVPQRLYERQPHVMHVIGVPLRWPVNIEGEQHDSTISVCKPLLKLLTKGRFKTHDCVTTARAILARGLFDVPQDVTTPIALLEYLVNHGCRDLRITST